MTVAYWPNHDMLSITLARIPYEGTGGLGESKEVHDGIVLHFGEDGRLAEIEISDASQQVDLDEIRRRYSFEELHESKSEDAQTAVGT